MLSGGIYFKTVVRQIYIVLNEISLVQGGWTLQNWGAGTNCLQGFCVDNLLDGAYYSYGKYAYTFVKLEVMESKCTVLISESILIGEAGFTDQLICFIRLADGSEKLAEDHAAAQWENDCYDKSENNKKGNPNKNGSSSGPKNDSNDNDESKAEKRQTMTDSNSGESGHHIVSNILMTSKSRPSNISRAASADNSLSPIKTAESTTQIIQSADGFTNKIVSPGPEATEMGKIPLNPSAQVKAKG